MSLDIIDGSIKIKDVGISKQVEFDILDTRTYKRIMSKEQLLEVIAKIEADLNEYKKLLDLLQ